MSPWRNVLVYVGNQWTFLHRGATKIITTQGVEYSDF